MASSALIYFDRIYVINLPNRTDRRREMGEQLQRIGLAFDRAPIQLFPAVRPAEAGPFPTIGTRGCFMSHLGVLRDADRAGHRRILILEDDVDFAVDFEAGLWPVVERLQAKPWDIFYGGHRIDPARWQPSDAAPLHAVNPDLEIVTSHFIGFAGSTIGEVAHYLERLLERPPGDPGGGPMHVDGAYSWYRASHPNRLTRVSTRQLARQRPSRTDIHALRWYDRWPGVRDVAERLRRWRDQA